MYRTKTFEETKLNDKKRIIFGVRKLNKLDSVSYVNDIPLQDSTVMSTKDIKEMEEDESTFKTLKKKSILDKIIIPENSKLKAAWDIYVNLIVAYSCIFTMYYVCFNTDPGKGQKIFDIFVEISFGFDILFNFITEYRDSETYERVRNLKLIAKKYVFRGVFLIDILAIFPFQQILSQQNDNRASFIKLLRLTRLPRLSKLVDTNRFNQLLKSLFEGNTSEERIILQYMVMYMFKIFRLFIIAILLTYFSGCLWHFIVFEQFDNGNKSAFYAEKLDGKDNQTKLIISCYYALTTLSTVGYGDYSPISDVEILTAVILMLCGVAFFSFIMGSFIEIIANYNSKMGIVDNSGQLRNWMLMLTRFTGNKPLSKSLYNQIEEHFAYFWQNDRLSSIHEHFDILNELPKSMKRKLMTSYLFEDIFTKFSLFFQLDKMKDSKFLYDISFGFVPRSFDPNNELDKILIDEEDEVPEMYFCLKGKVGIGYNLARKQNSKNQLKIAKYFRCYFLLCDYFVLNNKRSEFVYKVLEPVKCFALTKKFLLKHIQPKYPDIIANMKGESYKRYKQYIKTPILEHMKREIENQNKKSIYRVIQFQEKEELNKKTPGMEEQDLRIPQNYSKDTEIEMNKQLKLKMENIQDEVSTFSQNIGVFTSICDEQLDQLLSNIEKVTTHLKKVREEAAKKNLTEESKPFYLEEGSANVENNDKSNDYGVKDSFLFQDEYSDEEERFFQQKNQDRVVAKIQEDIDGIIEKGKKRSSRQIDLMKRKQAREQRLLQLDEAKTQLLMNFARVFSVSSIVNDDYQKAVIQSMLPLEYDDYLNFDFKNSNTFLKSLNFCQNYFHDMFYHFLDPKKECLVDQDSNFIDNLLNKRKLSKIEYLMLYVVFMNLHKLIVRTNFIIDISLLESENTIKVSRKSKNPNVQDKYKYGLQQQVSQKKRKYEDAFSQQAMKKDFEVEEEKIPSKNNIKRRKTDHYEEMISSQPSHEIMSFLDKFSYEPGKKSFTKARPSYSYASKTVNKNYDADLPESNLFLGNSKKGGEIIQKQKTDKIHKSHILNSTFDQELKETFGENFYIEIYDESNNRWYTSCPLTNQTYVATQQIQKYFEDHQYLYVLSSMRYKSYESQTSLIRKYTFIKEIGTTFISPKGLKNYMKAKNSCILTRSVNQYIDQFASYISFYADNKMKRIVECEDQILERIEMNFIPSTFSEFKNSKYYTLPSIIKKYQGFLPDAQPIEDKGFRGEPIFLKKDLTELHTVERWKKHARMVKEGEQPYKRVKGLYNDPEKLAELYGYWQTIQFKNELTSEGKIPMNQYGNIEIFNGPLPEGTVHIDIPKAAQICRKMGIHHVPAVVGFEKGGHGKSHPCVSGVVTFQEHLSEIKQEYQRMVEESKRRSQSKLMKDAKQAWKKVIKAILIKKYISTTYDTQKS